MMGRELAIVPSSEHRFDDIGQLGESLLVRLLIALLAAIPAILEVQAEEVSKQRAFRRRRDLRKVLGQVRALAGVVGGLEPVADRIDLDEVGHRQGRIVQGRPRIHAGFSSLQMARISRSFRSIVLVETFIASAISWVPWPSSLRNATERIAGSSSLARNRR